MNKQILIIGIIALVVGIILGAYTYGEVNACESFGGQIRSALDQDSASSCGFMNFLLYVGYGVILIGILLIVFALVK